MTAKYGWNNLFVYPFIDKNYCDENGSKIDLMYGCVGFEKSREYNTLQFCWIHPFKRNKG